MDKTKIIRAMELSAAAYRDIQPNIPSIRLSFIDDENGVKCFIRKRKNTLFITFRGSDSLKDWETDFTFWKKTIPYNNASSKIRVHTGFLNAYKNPGVRDALHGFVSKDINYIKISGHSYGAALAVLCAVDMQYNFPDRDIEAIVFGCPRIGNRAFQKSYDKRVFKTVRVENGNDIVTKVPFAILGYRHVGAKVHIGKPRLPAASASDHALRGYYSSLLTCLLR